MEYSFKPEGVCSREMKVILETGVIKKVTIVGGCAGNTVGIAKLLEGMSIDEAIKRMKNIPCGVKNTSCPDQLARGLEKIKEKIS